VAHLVDEAALDVGPREDGLDGGLKAREAVHTGDEDVLDPARLQIRRHREPEVGTLGPAPDPVAEHVPLALQVHPQQAGA
jgi:hypothetical protein